MSVTPAEPDTAAPPQRRFWPNFVVAAVMTPVIWIITQGLIDEGLIIAFYVVSIGTIPIAYAAVLLPGWRLLWSANGRASRLLAPFIVLLMLPSLTILLWGVYTAAYLVLLLVTVDF